MKKRFLGVLLCFCMIVGIMPTSVMALLDFDTVALKNAIYYDSGALKKFTVEFDWTDATATGRLVMMSKALRSPDEESYYGDFTNFGNYCYSFTNFDEVIAYDNENQTFGIAAYGDESTVWYDKTNTLEMSFDEDTLPLDKDNMYYVYLWTYYGGQTYPDALICVIRVQDGEVKYSPATSINGYNESEFAVIKPQELYNVKVVPTENMSITSTSGAELQNDLTGKMTPVAYTADTGYYFPEDYSVDAVNGIMVRRDSQSKITVYGTPTANVEITLTAPTQIVDTTDYLASVTFDGSTTGYATIDEAWAAAVALQTTETKKATITLLDNCTAADVLDNQSDYLVLNTNGKTLTICELPTKNDYIDYGGIKVSGGSLMINGNGKVTGLADGNYSKSIIYAGGGVVYVDGATIENTGTKYGIAVNVNSAEFHFLDGHIRSGNEYALNANLFAEVYLYSGTIEGNGSLVVSSVISRFVKICYSDKPLYLLNRTQDKIIQYSRHWALNDNVGMDLEYSNNYSGKNSTTITNATEISDTVSRGCYIKIQTFKKYTVTATAETGGAVSGGGDVKEGESITLTALSDDDYTFGGWYDGETRVSDEAVFTAENITEDKSYTAKFTTNQTAEPEPTPTPTPTSTPTPEPTPDPTPSELDFTSLRTLKAKNITVDHQSKTIDIEAADGAEYITILVHQKEIIPGGTFKMASYMGNKVTYDPKGSYRVYFVHDFTVPVKANITVDGVTEQYLVKVHFDTSKAKFDFTTLKGKGFSDVSVNHEDKTISVTANDNADNITLYVNQHDAVYGGNLRMASYMGNKVTYDPNGIYTIYANSKNSVSVKTNITINGVVEQYLITVDFPGIVWGFDTVKCDNVNNVSIDHASKTVTLDVNDGCDSILLYIDQPCPLSVKGQIWMKSYMGNDVVYNSADRTYTITKEDKNSITVKTKITMLGETRYYDMIINFAENN